MSPERAVPITPKEAIVKKQAMLPDAVLESFNELISLKWDGNSADVSQDDVIKLMVQKGLNHQQIFDNNWLDVEDIYRKAGWKVEYDKPGWDEDYDPYFIFSKKRRNPRGIYD